MRETPESTENLIDMDAVCELLSQRGVAAYVEYTGGGCATIRAGEQFTDAEGTQRWPALAGPGWFDPPMGTPGGSRAFAHPDEFYVGPDDDGVSRPVEPRTNNTEMIATTIADVVREQTRLDTGLDTGLDTRLDTE